MAAVAAVSPVRPPASTPALDSRYVMSTGMVKNEPSVAARESTRKTLWRPGRSPFSLRNPARPPTPSAVPKLEKKSGRKNANR